MYLYFDSTGTLKEIVNDSKVRQGSDNVNKLYFYFEDASAYSAIALTIKYPDGTTSTPYVITSNIATVTFPESLNKLSYFVEGKNYTMYYYTLQAGDLAQSGMCSATVVAYTGGSANAYGLFTFKVEQSVLAENITLTQTDLTYILEQIANISGDISVYVSNAEPTSIVSKLGRSQDSQSPTTLGENSVELGKNAEASADGTVALGEGVTASGINSTAIGNYSIASGTGSLAMLSGTAAGDDSISIGYNSQTYQKNAIALGITSKAYRTNDIAIGNNASAFGSNAIAFGVSADANGSETIAIGSAKAYNSFAIAIGDGANSANSYSISIGNIARVTGNEGIAIGYNTKVSNASAVAIGSGATSSANNAWQLGSGTNSGANSLQFMTRKIVDYNASRTGQEYALAVLSGGTTGQVLKKKSNTDYDYEWGQGGETVYVQPQGGVSTSITSSISSNVNMGTYVISLGYGAQSRGNYGIALGTSSTVASAGANGIAIGGGATVNGQYGVSLGYNSLSNNDYGVAIGYNAKANNGNDGSVAIGKSAETYSNGAIAIGYGANVNVSSVSAIAIGAGAGATGTGATQLGRGYNRQANTLQFQDIVIADGSTNKLAVKISSSIDPSTYVMTLNLLGTKWDSVNSVYNDITLSTTTIDLPLEEMIVSGSYDDNTKSIILTLRNNQTITIPVGDLVSGLQTQSNILDSISLLPTNQTGTIKLSNGTASLVTDDVFVRSSESINSSISTTSTGRYEVNLGYHTSNISDYGIILGYEAVSTATNDAIAIGKNSSVANDYGIAIGNDASTSDTSSVVQNTYSSIAIGHHATSTKARAMAMGYSASATGEEATALGCYAKASGLNSIAIGGNSIQYHETEASGNYSLALGYYTKASGNNSSAIGYNANVTANDAMQLGNGTNTQTRTLQYENCVIVDNDKLALSLNTSVLNDIVTIDLVGNYYDTLNSQYNTQVISTDTIDLTGYQTASTILTSISGLANNQTGLIKLTNGVASLDTNSYATTSALANYVTTSSLNTTLSSYVTTSSLNTTLGSYLTTATASTTYQPLSTILTNLSNISSSGAGMVYINNGAFNIDTSLNGGTTGQVLTKDSNNNGDYSWQNPSGAGAYTFKNYISTNTLPVSPQKGDVWISDSASPLVFTIGGGGGTLQAIQVSDTFAQGSYIYFDNSITDADMLTFLQGLTYVDGTCNLVTCEDDQQQEKGLVVAINMDVSEDPEDPQIIYALTCYTLTDDSVVWISDGSAMGMTTGWQTLNAEGGLLLDYPDGEQTLTVTTLNTVATGWNGVIVFNMVGGSSITLTLNKGDWLTYNGSSWDKVDNQEYATTSYVDSIVGNISTILESLVTV